MNDNRYKIRGNWKLDNESPATIGERFLETLLRLAPLSPVTNNWLFADPISAKPIPLNKVLPNLTELVEKGVSWDDDHSPDKRGGYRLFARGGEVESQYGSPRCVDVEVTAGSQGDNETSFAIGSRGADLKLITYPTYRGALDVLASTWPCPWLDAYLFVPAAVSRAGSKSGPPPRETYIFPWILYLSAPLAAGLSPPADIACERTPGGGMILSAVRERLDPDNPDHLRKSRLMQAIVAERIVKPKPPYGSDWPPRAGPY